MDLFSLGNLYVSDFLADGEQPRADPFPLRLVMDDDSGLVHLAEQPDPKLMWGRYWYRSGTNATMTRELGDIVLEIEQAVALAPGDVWVDIASNDGTLLSKLPDDRVRIGVDPCEFALDATPHADQVVQAPFDRDVADLLIEQHGHAKVVTCIAMFYDLMDPTDFLAGVHKLLDRDGLFVLQMGYTPLMLRQLAFDAICHEHARYYTLATLIDVLVQAGLVVVDAQLSDTNGGSFRIYAMRSDGDPARFATQPYRDVAEYRVQSLLTHEFNRGLNAPAVWWDFLERLVQLRSEVVDFIADIRTAGATIWGYGASTKGNTLLQYFGLDHTLIDGIAERQPAKFGLRTVGTDIPIYPEEVWRAARPDYTLMLPWHFVREFTEREAGYLAAGGRFIVPCPRFEIVDL